MSGCFEIEQTDISKKSEIFNIEGLKECDPKDTYLVITVESKRKVLQQIE